MDLDNVVLKIGSFDEHRKHIDADVLDETCWYCYCNDLDEDQEEDES